MCHLSLKRPLGYLDTGKLTASIDLQAPAQQLMTKFRRQNAYKGIDQLTPILHLSLVAG